MEYRRKISDSIRKLIARESSRQSSSPNHPSIGSICMVPDTIRNLNPGAYTPRIISIGPLHKEDQRLRALEEIKGTYVYRLFCEKEEPTYLTIDTCVQEVFERIGQARACYGTSFTYYDDVQLAEMMVIDGCFILELLHRSEHGIMAGDPIFDNIFVKHGVKYDLLLLENQIPFFILEILFRLIVKPILRSSSLTDLILCFFKDMNILNNSEELTLENGIVEHCHILGLLQSCYRPGGTDPGGVPTIRYSATEIAGAGVIFKPQVQLNRDSLLAVQFLQSHVPGFGKLFIREASFKIPVLRIEDSTSSFLRNLIAYEQCYSSSRPYVTSFAFLMDMLIDTNDDVSLLVRAKVLQHNLGACEDVTNLFNNICNGVVRRDFYYSAEWTELDDYRSRFWPRILISLRRLYRSTTWKTLTVIAAVVIFTLTLIQTIYGVRNA